MYIAFFASIIVYLAVFVPLVFRRVSKFHDAAITEKVKCGTYYHLIIGLWVGVVIVFIMSFLAGLSFADIGLRPMRFAHGLWFTVITLSFGGLVFIFSLYQMITLLLSEKHKEAAEKQYGNHAILRGILPRSKKEKYLFSLVSLSAGICEEIIFRGFMLLLLQAIFPGISIFLVILIPSILFGISHFYQRLQGIIATAVFGMFFMCLFVVTDSLILPMLLHFFYDFSTTFTLGKPRASPASATQ